MVKSKLFLYLIVSSKMSLIASGNTRHVIQEDIKRMENIILIEFIVIVCIVAEQLYKNEEVDG